MKELNFIYFSTSSGFFIGIIYSMFKDLDFFGFLFTTFLITAVFFIIAQAGVAFFVKFLDIKNIVYFNKNEIDEILNMQIKELEKNESFIYENYEFIEQIEKEELQIIKKNRHEQSL